MLSNHAKRHQPNKQEVLLASQRSIYAFHGLSVGLFATDDYWVHRNQELTLIGVFGTLKEDGKYLVEDHHGKCQGTEEAEL